LQLTKISNDNYGDVSQAIQLKQNLEWQVSGTTIRNNYFMLV